MTEENIERRNASGSGSSRQKHITRSVDMAQLLMFPMASPFTGAAVRAGPTTKGQDIPERGEGSVEALTQTHTKEEHCHANEVATISDLFHFIYIFLLFVC